MAFNNNLGEFLPCAYRDAEGTEVLKVVTTICTGSQMIKHSRKMDRRFTCTQPVFKVKYSNPPRHSKARTSKLYQNKGSSSAWTIKRTKMSSANKVTERQYKNLPAHSEVHRCAYLRYRVEHQDLGLLQHSR